MSDLDQQLQEDGLQKAQIVATPNSSLQSVRKRSRSLPELNSNTVNLSLVPGDCPEGHSEPLTAMVATTDASHFPVDGNQLAAPPGNEVCPRQRVFYTHVVNKGTVPLSHTPSGYVTREPTVQYAGTFTSPVVSGFPQSTAPEKVQMRPHDGVFHSQAFPSYGHFHLPGGDAYPEMTPNYPNSTSYSSHAPPSSFLPFPANSSSSFMERSSSHRQQVHYNNSGDVHSAETPGFVVPYSTSQLPPPLIPAASLEDFPDHSIAGSSPGYNGSHVHKVEPPVPPLSGQQPEPSITVSSRQPKIIMPKPTTESLLGTGSLGNHVDRSKLTVATPRIIRSRSRLEWQGVGGEPSVGETEEVEGVSRDSLTAASSAMEHLVEPQLFTKRCVCV